MAFALAVPFAWNILYPDFHVAALSHLSLPQRVFLTLLSKTALHALPQSVSIGCSILSSQCLLPSETILVVCVRTLFFLLCENIGLFSTLSLG